MERGQWAAAVFALLQVACATEPGDTIINVHTGDTGGAASGGAASIGGGGPTGATSSGGFAGEGVPSGGAAPTGGAGGAGGIGGQDAPGGAGSSTGGSDSTGGASTGGAPSPCDTRVCLGLRPFCYDAPPYETTGSCVMCLKDEHCSGSKPRCDPDSHECVECLGHSDCTAPGATRCYENSHTCELCAEGDTRSCSGWGCEGTQTCVGGGGSFGACISSSDPSKHCDVAESGCQGGTPEGVRCPDGQCYAPGTICD